MSRCEIRDMRFEKLTPSMTLLLIRQNDEYDTAVFSSIKIATPSYLRFAKTGRVYLHFIAVGAKISILVYTS